MDHPAAPGDIAQKYQKYRFDSMKRGLFGSILASQDFQAAADTIERYIYHAPREEAEEAIMQRLFTPVCNAAKRIFGEKVCCHCKERDCVELKGIAFSAAADALIHAVKSFQGSHDDHMDNKTAFLNYLAVTLAGKLTKEKSRQCPANRFDMEPLDDKQDILRAPQQQSFGGLFPPDPYEPVDDRIENLHTIISDWMSGVRGHLTARLFVHFQFIVAALTEILPNAESDARREEVMLFLAMQKNINRPGFSAAKDRVVTQCCQQDNAFYQHQKRVREAIRKSLDEYRQKDILAGGDSYA